MLNLEHDANAPQIICGGSSRVFHPGDAVKPFRFHRDPLFLLCCAAYAVNRWLLKPLLPDPFLQGYFNDLWLIPCALPLVLWLHRRLGWRGDAPPTFVEVVTHLLFWSALFEWWGPRLMQHATGDSLDVVCYWAGGLLAWAWWNRTIPSRRLAPA